MWWYYLAVDDLSCVSCNQVSMANCMVQRDFVHTMDGPDSSYSSVLIHSDWKVDEEASLEPPSQAAISFLLSAYLYVLLALWMLICIVKSRTFNIDLSSFCIRSAIPGIMDVPPHRTMFAYRSLMWPLSHLLIESNKMLWTPMAFGFLPIKDVWKSASGQRNSSSPMVMSCECHKGHSWVTV